MRRRSDGRPSSVVVENDLKGQTGRLTAKGGNILGQGLSFRNRDKDKDRDRDNRDRDRDREEKPRQRTLLGLIM